jgi:hypothetical protein
MGKCGSRQDVELFGQIRRCHVSRPAGERHAGALQRPHDQGNTALLTAIANLEPIPQQNREREKNKTQSTVFLSQTGVCVTRCPGSVGGGQVKINVVKILIPIFFDAAESNAGMKHLDEMSFGANDDSRVTPPRTRTTSPGRDPVCFGPARNAYSRLTAPSLPAQP